MSKSSDAVKRWRKNTKDRMVQSMGGECQCCGYNRTNNALAFHHLDPKEKDLNFGGTRANPQSWKKITEELQKCILVCHNCHAEIHAGIRDIPTERKTFDTSYIVYKDTFPYDTCPVCESQKPISQKFCSHKCAQTNSRRVKWDSIDLPALMEKHTIRELEDMLGVSNAAIYKQRKKLLLHR